MDGSRHKLFACSRFTRNQNCGISWRNFGNARENGLQRRGGSDNLLKHRSLINLFPESGVFPLQSLLRSLAILNVGTREVPPNELSLAVAERVVTNQKPAICPVALPEPQVPLVIGRVRRRTIDKRLDSIDVVRMHFSQKTSRAPFLKGDAEIGERKAVAYRRSRLGPTKTMIWGARSSICRS